MDRRRCLAALAGGLAAMAGCASIEPNGTAGPGTEPSPMASPGSVHAGPAVTARAPEPSAAPPSTTAVTSTGTVTVTPPQTDATPSDGGGSSGGGSGAPEPADPTTATPTVTTDGTETGSPLRLSLSSVTMQRVVGELTCTAGPLAWMAVEVAFRRGGEPVDSGRRRRDEPGTGETLAFDVASEEPDLDGVRLVTAYAHPPS